MSFSLEQLNQQLGSGVQPPSGNSFSLDQLNSKLDSPIIPEPKVEKPGFIKSLAKGLLEPVANLVARPGQLVQHLAGDKQPIEGKFLGLDITDPYSRGSSEVLRDIGRGLETVSLGIGGGGAKSVVESGVKGLFKQGVKEGVTTGLKTGLLQGAGQSLEKGNTDVGTITYDTLFGGGAGALLGGVTGGILPVLSKGVTGASAAKTALTTEEGLITQLAERNRKVLNPTQRMSAVEDRFFKDTPTFIAQEFPDMPIQIEKGKLELTDGINGLSQKYNAEELAFDSILKGSGKYVNINEIESDAKQQILKSFSGTQREKALQAVQDEVQAFVRQAHDDGYLIDGKGGLFNIPATEANIFKRSLWQRTKGFGSPESEIQNQANYVLGSAFKNGIEKVLDDAPVKAMNQRLGDFISAIKFLEKRNGAVPGTGGKMARYFIRTMGSIAGSGAGIPGSITGAITADRLATIMADPTITTSIFNKLLKNVAKSERSSIVQEAQNLFNQRAKQAAEVIKLPPGGGSSFNASNIPIIPPAPTTFENAASNINRANTDPSLLYKKNVSNALSQAELDLRNKFIQSNSQEAITIPTTIVKSSDISSSIAKNSEGINSSLIQEAKKYKSAEDFVKAQQKLLHGTKTNFDKFDLSKSGDVQHSDWGSGAYFTDNIGNAKNFAKVAGGDVVLERYAPNIKYADGSKLLKDSGFMNALDDGMEFTTPAEYLNKKGYGGVKFRNPQGFTEYVIFDPEHILTKSQLKDIWNKANKK